MFRAERCREGWKIQGDFIDDRVKKSHREIEGGGFAQDLAGLWMS